MLKQTSLRLCLLLAPALGVACVSSSPARVTSPDAELASLLGDLRELRGGEFSMGVDGLSDADGARTAAAAREGAIARELRELGFVYPRHVPSLVANAALAYERNDSVGAQKYLDQALRHDPTHIPATLLRVRIASEGGNLPYARRKLQEQIELAPDSPELREAYSGVLYLMGEYGDALAELDLVEHLRGEPDGTWRTNYHRGLIAEAGGHLDQARVHFGLSQEQKPSFDPAARRERWLDSRTPQIPR